MGWNAGWENPLAEHLAMGLREVGWVDRRVSNSKSHEDEGCSAGSSEALCLNLMILELLRVGRFPR